MKRVILLVATSSLALIAGDGVAQTTAPAAPPAAAPAPTPAPAPAPTPAAAPAAAPAPRPADDFGEHYAILAEKNIFVRGRPPTRRGGAPTQERPRRAEEAYVLTGVTLSDGRNVAFIENTGTRATERVVQGASIAGGKVIDVKFDSLEFETGGSRFRVNVGRNLLGDVARPSNGNGGGGSSSTSSGNGSSPTTAASNGGSGSASPAPAAGGSPDEPGLSPEERLKRRRQQLLNK